MLKYRKLVLIGLTVCLSLSANAAFAAHQLVEQKKGTIKLEPTPAAKDATGRIKYQITRKSGDPQANVVLEADAHVQGLKHPQNAEVVATGGKPDRTVTLGRLNKRGELKGKLSVPGNHLKDLKAFNAIKIVRRDKIGVKDQVLFTAELPHHPRY